MKSAITKEVLFSYFAGTSTALQKKLIEVWIKEEENRELFFQWLFEWEQNNIQYHVDVDEGIERHRKWVLSRKDHDALVQEAPKEPSTPLRRWWIAASVVLLSISLGWIMREKILFREFSTQYGEIKKMTLADGSKVVLNANSTLKFPRITFRNDLREVYLIGEASFDVVHTTDDRRFLVHANDGVEVAVLGTTFNVYTRSSGTKIALEEGKVQLNYREGNQKESVIMKPGDLATVAPNGSFQMTHTEQPGQYAAWKYHRFIFEDQSFREIAQKLEEVFGTRLTIENEALAIEPVTGSFTALDAEELLDALKEAKGFSYIRKGNEIVIISEKNVL